MNAQLKSVLLSAVLILSANASADTYQIIQQATTQPADGILRTEYRVQIGTNPLNQISVTRIRRDLADHQFRGPVMLMSPFNFDVRFYEIRKGASYRSSFAGNLAQDKFDVWVVDDRINRGSVQDCANPTVDCSVMATWTVSARVEDAEFARSLVVPHHPGIKPAIGGAVGGGIAAIAAINAHPGEYQGLFSIQGATYTQDPAVQAYNQPFCAFGQSLLANGVIFDGSPELFVVLTYLAYNAPGAPADPALVQQIEAAIPGLDIPDGLTNHQLLVFIFSTHLNNPNFPTPTWITAIGSYQQDKFFRVDEGQLQQMATQFNRIAALPQLVEFLCNLAGTQNTIQNNLGAFTGKVLLLGSELAFGPELIDTAALFTNAQDVDAENLPEMGELDLVLNKHREHLVDRPVSRFLKRLFKDDRRR